jgi:predicted MPP superfamily phosphohydrolase
LSFENKTTNKNLPGRSGNRFDTILHAGNRIEEAHPILFGLFLIVFAILATRFNWLYSAIVFGFMLVDWLLVALLPRAKQSFGPTKPAVLILSILRATFALLPIPVSLILQTIGTLLVIYGFWIEPAHLTVTRETLTSDKVKPGALLRVMHLGDLHIERITRRERQLQILIESMKPDLILFSGDVLNLSYRNDPTAIQAAREVIGAWKAPLGVYLVSGSPAVDLPDVFPEIIKGLPVCWLRDERITIPYSDGEINLVGLSCSHDPQKDSQLLQKILSTGNRDLTILLYHSPDMAPQSALLGIDLQLSGHTHGGQVRLPFFGALYTASLTGKRFEAGRVQVGNMVVYVTRGIGMEGAAAPRVRFLCPPEVILWYISSPQDVAAP